MDEVVDEISLPIEHKKHEVKLHITEVKKHKSAIELEEFDGTAD